MQEKRESSGLKQFLKDKLIFIVIWLFCFIVVSVVFLVKLDDIKTNLKNTRFFERIFGVTPSFIENHIDKTELSKSDLGTGETVILLPGASRNSENVSVWTRADSLALEKENAQTDEVPQNQETQEEIGESDINNSSSISYEIEESEEESQNSEDSSEENFVPESIPVEYADKNLSREEQPPQNENVETATAKLWFVAVDADGRITRNLRSRKIVRMAAPLTNNIKLLLQGPNSQELDSGCLSLIPEGTRLLNALVKDGIAYLNFSAEFENNRLGAEGYLAQLQQVIYTSTEFATVTSVQILIEGQKKDTLGDGVWIGSPLSRANFR